MTCGGRLGALGALALAASSLAACSTDDPEVEERLLAAAPAAAGETPAAETTSLGPATVDYRRAVAKPAQACAALTALGRPQTSVLWAVSQPATERLPAHCEVRGLIEPAVSFRLQLPEAWNGRFYMAGNGGLAGEPV